MRQSGLLLDDNRDVSEACVTRPLIEIGSVGESTEDGRLGKNYFIKWYWLFWVLRCIGNIPTM